MRSIRLPRPFAALLCTLMLALSRRETRADDLTPPRIHPWVLSHTEDGQEAEFLVVLSRQADLADARELTTKAEKGLFVRDALLSVATETQRPLLSLLEQRGIPHRSFYIVNAILVKGGRDLVLELAARPDVLRLEGNPVVANLRPVDDVETSFTVGTNIQNTRAPEVWAMGFTGQGIVIGGQDTGYEWTHPALKPHYRGWNGTTASHDFNWHDSVHSGGGVCGANSPSPCDDNNHGTHTMGTTNGDDGAGNQIGMAPGVRWIGCRNMDQGDGTPASYLECFEFFLAPYPVAGTPAQGDPLKAPDVTNNSWGCPASEGCSAPTLLAAVQAQRAAGIMTVVSAGNAGSSCSTVNDPPAIYDEVYSVGALTTGTDTIASFSSRGPVTLDGSNRLKPDISAPGTSIRSSVRGGGYAQSGWSGTSMAGPHVAGAVALIWSAIPALKHDIARTEALLNAGAVPISSASCSSSGVPNNVFGYGRLDVKAAVDLCLTPLTATANGPICAGQTLQLSTPTVAGGTYSWTGPNGFTSTQQNPSIPGATVAASGTYVVSVSGGVCSRPNGSVNVTVTAAPAQPVATAGSPVCAGDTLQLSATDVPGATYAWTGPNGFSSTSRTATIPGVTAAATGTYSVVVALGGCASPAGTVGVVVTPRPATPVPTSNGPICAGQDLLLSTATLAGATYQWSGPNGFSSTQQNPSLPSATTAATGTYSVVVTQAGCASLAGTVGVTVKAVPATPTASSNGPICAGQTLQLSTAALAGASYQWSGPGGFSSTLQSPSVPSATTAASGTYSVVVTQGGCASAAGTVSVTVQPLPAAPTASSNGAICAGQTLQLLASTVPGAAYSWSGPNGFTSTQQNPTVPNATAAASGVYTVTATLSGCVSPGGTTSVLVKSLPSTPTASTGGPVCAGQPLQLFASTVPGASYAWTGPNGFTSTQQNPTVPNATAAATGTYSVTATVDGCPSAAGTTSATVTAIPATPAPTANGPLCPGQTLLLVGPSVPGASYSWTGPNGFASTSQSPTLANATAAAAGTYTLTLTVAGCTSAPGSTTVVVNPTPATPTASATSPLCSGSTLQLTAAAVAGATYAWTGPNGFTSTQQNPVISPVTTAAAGTYSVTANVGGCGSSSSSIDVVVSPGDATPVVTPPLALKLVQSTCVGGLPAVTPATLDARDPVASALLSAFLAGGSAVDDCGTPTRLDPLLGASPVGPDTLFAVGDDPVAFRYSDSGGRVGSASGLVTVRRQGDVDENGLVDISDNLIIQALMVGNLSAGVPPFNAAARVADANGDGVIDIFDVVVHQAFLVGNVSCLTP